MTAARICTVVFLMILLQAPGFGDPSPSPSPSGSPSPSPSGPTPDVEGAMSLDPASQRLGALVPHPDTGRPAALNEYLAENFGELLPDPANSSIAIVPSGALQDHAVILVFLKDSNGPPFGNVEAKLRLPSSIDGCSSTSTSGVCLFAYRIGGNAPRYLSDPSNSWESVGALSSTFTPAVAAVIVLRNLDPSPRTLSTGSVKLRLKHGQEVENNFEIKLGGAGEFKCRLAVTGAIGDTHSKSCNSAACDPDATTNVENAVLKFKPIIEGVSFSRSRIKDVSYSGGPNSQGIWDDATTDVESTVVATVTTSTNKEIYCALKIKPMGVAFRVAAQRAGTCELFKSLREYYLLNSDNTRPMRETEGYRNCEGLSINGLKTLGGQPYFYGKCDTPQSDNPNFTKGPGLPLAGVLNFGVDTTGFVSIGVGGNVVLPPIENRQFAGAVLTVSEYNETSSDSFSSFAAPSYYAIVPPTGDLSSLAMIPTGAGGPLEGDRRVMFRMFLARSIREGGTVERRGTNLTCRGGAPCPPAWSFDPALGDLMVPFMDDSCMAIGQVSPPERGDKPAPVAMQNGRLCLNSKPYKFSSVSNGRLRLKVLTLSPEHPWHEFPTNLLRRSTPPTGCSAGGTQPTKECWNFTWDSLPPNIGDEARSSHDACVSWKLVNTTVVHHDRYGRPYNVTVPTYVREFKESCPVLEVASECSAGLAIRFNGYAMMRAAALGCVQKYHNGTIRNLSGVPVSATLPNQGILPYNATLGGAEPNRYSSYGPGTEGFGCVPCRFAASGANTATMPLDQDNRYPIFSFTRERAPSDCVQNANLEVRYFGSAACTGTTFPEGHFCKSENIDGRSCPGISEDLGSKGIFSGSANVAGKFSVPLCPGAGLPFDDVALSWSPLLVDVGGEGFRISRSFEKAVSFDIKGTGKKFLIDWPLNTERTAFLVHPQRGQVTSIKQLFGDYGAENGFEALKKFDSNQDKVISTKDKKFRELFLWFDRNRDGISQKSEIETLAKHGVETIYLDYTKPLTKGIEGKMLSGTYYSTRTKNFLNIADIFFYEYMKNGSRISSRKSNSKGS